MLSLEQRSVANHVELAGQQISKYEMLEEVGHGGMAVVYRGRDRVLDREVAIKVLHPHLADRVESRRRLRREALTVAKLRHGNIVEIYDYAGPDDGLSFIVTEFIHGRTLRWWLEGRWTPRPVLAALIAYRLSHALTHAHEIGIVHRDIKPENVMIRRDGCLKLMDFGIARILDDQKLTMTGQLLGSPAYMAPEIISGRPVDGRSDLFSLGILLYQLATGTLPFNGRNPHEVLSKIASAEFTPPGSINPRVDDDLEAIICKALAREPAERYQSSAGFGSALRDYLSALGIDADGDDLEKFFRNGERQARLLDERVCQTLLDKGERAAEDGQSARALRYVGQALEIEPDNLTALGLLERVKARGRRLRQLLSITAILGLGGVICAGVLLIKSQPPTAIAATSPNASSVEAPLIDSKKVTDKPPRVDAVETELQAINSSSNPERSPDRIRLEAASSTEDIDDSELTDAEHSPSSPLRAHPSRPNRAVDNGRAGTTAEPTETPFECRIFVEELPIPTRGHYALVDQATQERYRLPRSAQSPIIVNSNADLLRLELEPASVGGHKSYEGRIALDRSACESNQSPARLHAKALPALLQFKAVNFRLEDLVVQCITNCGEDQNRKRMATTFSRINLEPDALEQSVRFRFWVEGYAKLEKTFRLRPGHNELSIRLQPLDEATTAP